jgi:hypothetical protein
MRQMERTMCIVPGENSPDSTHTLAVKARGLKLCNQILFSQEVVLFGGRKIQIKMTPVLSQKINQLVEETKKLESEELNPRVKAMVVTKLQEAMLLAEQLTNKSF